MRKEYNLWVKLNCGLVRVLMMVGSKLLGRIGVGYFGLSGLRND